MGTDVHVLAEESVLAAPPRPAVSTRLTGIDAARALAFGGMLLAHFAASRRSTDPGWLQAVDNAADGRAAPLFCLLLGVGAGLLAAKGTSDGAFVRRGLVLFGLGLVLWPFVDDVYLILPHYGILLALFPLVRRTSTRWLLPAAGVTFLLPSLVVATVGDLGLRASGQPSTYADLLDAPTVLGGLLWTGGYPLVGWAGFVLVGAWVVRLRLGDARVQRTLLLGSVAVAAAQPLVAAAYRAFDGAPFLDSAAHS
ncbi:MAG: heparan-alpha-glucosaminide N-acetyltransferase domain-containing protein, partial [Actinomycetota bacterium]|nr:heparan-alpha-glucosaminide N-acetyltransferase domain-containing protein [Actinomycetota bacterium]